MSQFHPIAVLGILSACICIGVAMLHDVVGLMGAIIVSVMATLFAAWVCDA